MCENNDHLYALGPGGSKIVWEIVRNWSNSGKKTEPIFICKKVTSVKENCPDISEQPKALIAGALRRTKRKWKMFCSRSWPALWCLFFNIDPRGRPTVTACNDHCFCACSYVRPSVRPHFSKNTNFKRKHCSLLWVWPSGSLRTPALFYSFFSPQKKFWL